MKLLRGMRRKFQALFQKGRLDDDMDAEMRCHVEMRTQQNIDGGMNPEEARFAAWRQFGRPESIKETCRDQRGTLLIENLLQDARLGARQLCKNTGFTLAAVLTLGLGIGANTAIFSLVNALLFRPLPFREPNRLVWIANPVAAGGEGFPGANRRTNLRDWRELSRSFEDLGGYVAFFDRLSGTLTGSGEPARLETLAVTGSFLNVLGVAPRLGRNFTDEECQRNGPRAIILTDSFWRRRCQADPAIIGRPLTINNQSWTVAGVLPSSFEFSSVFSPGARAVDFLRPFPYINDDVSGNWMSVIGRLKPGVTIAAAQKELDLLNQRLQSAHPERGRFGARLIPLREQVSGEFRRPFIVLACAVGCVLLIACVNFSNLQLARAAARRKEMAIRIALGAGRWRLIRQLLTESTLLSFCGAALGLPVAYLATNTLAQSRAFSIPLLQSARVDVTALGFTFLIAICAGILFGIAPALQLSNADLRADLKEANRRGRRSWLRESLVVSEVALACVLLVGAGLLTRSLARLIEVDPGFQSERVAAWRITPNRQFTDNTLETLFYEELVRRIEALPDVESAGLTFALPFALNDATNVRAKGETYREGEMPGASISEVDRGYLKTLRVPLKAGRYFNSSDTPHDVHHSGAGAKVVIVNQNLARLLWAGKNAVGKTLFIDGPPDPPIECDVIGVVGNMRRNSMEQEAGPELYLLGEGQELVVRTKGTLEALIPAVRATLREINPGMAADEFQPLARIVDQALSPKRLITILLGLFSLLALILASIGIYGVIAYSVSQRTREIGIRLALGSSKPAVLRLVLAEGMRVAFIGCVIGLLASLALTRIIQALLFAVSPTDPLTFAASSLLLASVTLLACWLPARRAARVDPMAALRHD